MASVSIFNLTAGAALASADVLPFVDVSDHTQSAEGSTLKITVADFFGTVPAPVVVTSTTAPQLTLAYDGTHSATWTVSSAGALTLNATSTITITPATTVTGLATLNGGATVASGQTLTVTGATITGLTAASVAAGTFPGVYTITGALTLSSTLTAASTSAHTLGTVTLTNGVVAGVTNLTWTGKLLFGTSGALGGSSPIQTRFAGAWLVGQYSATAGDAASSFGPSSQFVMDLDCYSVSSLGPIALHINRTGGGTTFFHGALDVVTGTVTIESGDLSLAATKKVMLSSTSYITEAATGTIKLAPGGVGYLLLTNGKGFVYNGATTTNMGDGNLAIGSSAAPTGNPAAGTFFIWMDSTSSALKARGPSGTVTTIAAP